VGGFEEEPLKLPRFSLDCFILAEVYHQLVVVTLNFFPKDKRDNLFPVRIGTDLGAFDFKF